MSDTQDPAKGLSEEGRMQVKSVGAQLQSHEWAQVDKIIHSPKARAQQTAGILSDLFNPAQGHEESADLTPNADPTIISRQLEAATGNIMIVGHLPHLPKLAAILMGCDPENPPITLDTGSIVALDRIEHAFWQVFWLGSV